MRPVANVGDHKMGYVMLAVAVGFHGRYWVHLGVAAGLHRQCQVFPVVAVGAPWWCFASGGTKFQGPMRQSMLLTLSFGEGPCPAEPELFCPSLAFGPSVWPAHGLSEGGQLREW